MGKSNTYNSLKKRIKSHFNCKGAYWTKLFNPKCVVKIYKEKDDFDEDKYTKIYMYKYGIKNVRGGSYSKLVLEKKQIEMLKKEFKTVSNKCYKCGKEGHFIKYCNDYKVKKWSLKEELFLIYSIVNCRKLLCIMNDLDRCYTEVINKVVELKNNHMLS